MNPFPGAFHKLCSGFSIFLAISQKLRLINIKSINTNGEFRVPAGIEIEFFVMIVNSIAKSPILDVLRVSG